VHGGCVLPKNDVPEGIVVAPLICISTCHGAYEVSIDKIVVEQCYAVIVDAVLWYVAQ